MRKAWKLVDYGCKENPGIFDTGNGAIQIVETNARYPGIERVTVRSYCGRDWQNHRWYRDAISKEKVSCARI